jgi:hypothetical protein
MEMKAAAWLIKVKGTRLEIVISHAKEVTPQFASPRKFLKALNF